MVLVDMGVTNEIGEPARRVARQTTDQAQQRRAFGQVERRAQTQIVRTDVEGQRDFTRLRVRMQLIQQVAILRTRYSLSGFFLLLSVN